jgi:hypothetical protein
MKVGYFITVILNIILVTTLLVPVYGSVYNRYCVQALPISAEKPRVILQQGTTGSSTIYTNNTSAKTNVVAPAPVPTYYPSSHNIIGGNWWNQSYGYRKRITVVNNVASSLSSGYSVYLTENTASLMSAGKMLSGGNDLRILYWNATSSIWIELNRDVVNINTALTKVWFKTQKDISASSSDSNYYIYYGNPSAVNPPANRRNVYDFWDDFDDGSLDPAWTFSQIGTAVGSYSESGTEVVLNATTTGDLWDTVDNILFLSISRSYDVLVESYTSQWGGSNNTWSKTGGVQLRQSLDANSKNRIMSSVYSAVGATNSYRLSTGGSTSEQTTATQSKYCRLTRIGGISRAWYSTDGVSWTELGSQISFSGGLADPVRLGIHLAGLSSSTHWVEVDWFKVRKYVEPEPSVFVGSEEQSYHVSGTVPASVQTVDSSYFVVRSAGSTTSTTVYNPSIYNLLGSTALVSGTTSDLVSNNGVYMQFRSYEIVSTAKTDAFIAYRDSTTSLMTPKGRTWTGDTATWDSQGELPTSNSPVRFVRVVYSSIQARSYEKIVVTLSNNGFLDAYVWDGTTWLVTNDIGSVGTTANAYRAFDVAYEKTSGKAMLVYAIGSTSTTQDLAYKTWNGTVWSTESYIDDTGHATDIQYYWVYLAPKQTTSSNEISLVGIDGTDFNTVAWIWNGNSWGNINELTANSATDSREDAAVAYETISGKAVFGYGVSGANIQSKIWDGTGWNNTASTLNIDGATSYWITMKSDPASDRIMLTSVDSTTDLNTFLWNASPMTWARGTGTDHDADVDTNARRCADFEWEPTGSKGLLVWGTTAGQITYRTFTAPSTWGTIQNVAMGANTHPWVQLRVNSRSISGDVKILGAVMEATVFGIGAIAWDGTTFTVIGTNTISLGTTTVITYECFEIEFQRFGPRQFASEVELTGTSNTESWTELVWSIDSAWTIGSVTVTIQVYNYTLGAYPTSGNGYDSYTSSATANTDETRNQTLTTNPTHFRDGLGNWKIKVKGVKTTTSQFDFKADWVEYKSSHYTEYTASTEFLFSSMTKNTPTQLNFTVVSEYDIANVLVTIQVWNYSSSTYMTSGEGYLTYTSSGTNETKLLSINTNPQFYTSSGYAKIKVTGVKSTTTQFQQKTNQIKLDYRYSASNYALDYDGSNDYVEVPDSASLDITGEITVEAWIKPIAFTHEFPSIVCKWDWSSTNPQRSYALYLMTFKYPCIMVSTDGTYLDQQVSATPLAINTWYYLVGVSTGTKWILYINGAWDSEKAKETTINSGTAKLSIGASLKDGSVATDETFNGLIDEVRISNVSRSASEISGNWNGGQGKRLEADANTVALWHFDEGTGDTTYDKTANNNNGTLKPTYPSDCPSWVNGFSFPTQTYDYVLKVVNQVADSWTVNLKVYNNANIDRLSSLNISLHDGTSSNQIAISGGTIIKSEGEPYNLPGGLGSAIKISISNLQATTTDTSYLYVYLKIKVPNTSTYNLFIIVFEIT